MTRWSKSALVAGLHVLVVADLGAKLLYDRATRPRVWMRAKPYDPDEPLRGRYVRLRPEAVDVLGPGDVVPDGDGFRIVRRPTTKYDVVDEPVAFFIPEHVPDPSQRSEGEQLWMEVTLPKAGPPRPIRLAVLRGDRLTPLPLD